MHRRPVSQILSMFINSLWDVKEPTHYLIRVGDVVQGVRLSSDVSKKAYGV